MAGTVFTVSYFLLSVATPQYFKTVFDIMFCDLKLLIQRKVKKICY